MSKAPEFVVTGVHVPKVRFWARVLVRPDRLQQVKQSILRMGRAHLRPGEVLEVDTMPGDEIEEAMTVMHRDVDRLTGACIVAWNETGDVTIYSDDADRVAAITAPVTIALVDRDPHELLTKAVCLHCETIDSIHVGSVHVHFDRPDEAKAPREDDAVEDIKLRPGTEFTLPPGTLIGVASEEEMDEWLVSCRLISNLQAQILAERVRIQRLGVRPRRS